MAKHDATGRSKGESRHVRLYHYLLVSPAWQSLSAIERCVYLEILTRYNGSNNGFVSFSNREGAESLKASKNTIGRAVNSLIKRGFVEITMQGSFNQKSRHATEYRLTDLNCDRTHQPPKRTFMRWGKTPSNEKITVSPRTFTVPDMTSSR